MKFRGLFALVMALSAAFLACVASEESPLFMPVFDAGNVDFDAGTAPDVPTFQTFSVGGTVSGLVGDGLVLQNGDGAELTINADGTFTFPEPISEGANYDITVKTQPTSPSQTCTVGNGSGTLSASVTDITISCVVNRFTVGGAVTGLLGTGLVLQINGAEELSVAANGTFVFTSTVASGDSFSVAVKTHPSGPLQACSVGGHSGVVGNGNVTSITVDCATDRFIVGGTVEGLAGTVVLQNNLGDDLTITSNGQFAFPTAIESGATYAVTVRTNPTTPSQTCTLGSETGAVVGANITSVTLSCRTNSFLIRGKVEGLEGGGLVLQNNGGDDLAVRTNGDFEFATAVPSGRGYAVTVSANPVRPPQTCVVSNPRGMVTTAPISDVVVVCSTTPFGIGGTVTGLEPKLRQTVTIQNNGGDDLVLAANGRFSFRTPIASGRSYEVTIKEASRGVQCIVRSPRGTVGDAAVTSVAVVCDIVRTVGTVSGTTFYSVEVAGAMTDPNVAAACRSVGLIVPCVTASSSDLCVYNQGGCQANSAERVCNSPMSNLSNSLCKTEPHNCPTLAGVYQFMGGSWSGGSCGAEPGDWCARGDGAVDRKALCVSPIVIF